MTMTMAITYYDWPNWVIQERGWVISIPTHTKMQVYHQMNGEAIIFQSWAHLLGSVYEGKIPIPKV